MNKRINIILSETTVRDRDLDREIEADWRAVAIEGWEQHDTRSKDVGPEAMKSTSRTVANRLSKVTIVGLSPRP